MGIRCTHFSAVVCVLVGALCLTPSLAATAKPGAHPARVHAGAKLTAKHSPAAGKGQRVKPRATASAARKVGKPHAVATGARPSPRTSARAQRKPVSDQHGALRPTSGKKPVRSGAGRHALKPVAAKSGTKAHATAVGKRNTRKPAGLRPGHKKTAH